jgi:DNA-binding transcriptional ArsR family regulator
VKSSVDGTLAALADPTRRGVVDLLRERPHRASEIADAMATSRPAMSRHLRVLRKTGLVEERELPEDARVRVYQLRQKPFTELRSWVEEVEAFWSDQLQAFKAHAEQRRPRRP